MGFILSGSVFGVGVCGDQPPSAAWIAGGRALAYFSAGIPELRISKLADRRSELLLSHEALAKLQGSDEACSANSRWRLIASQKSAGWLVLENSHKIVLFNVTTRRVRVLLSSRSPITAIEISPDDAWISYVRDGKVELSSLGSGSVQPLVPGAKAGTTVGDAGPAMRSQFHMNTGYWWAPDSSRIAYLQSESVRTQQVRAGQPLPLTALWVCTIRNGARQQIDLGNLNDRYLPLAVVPRQSAASCRGSESRADFVVSLVG